MTEIAKLARTLTPSLPGLRLRQGVVQTVNSDLTVDLTIGASTVVITGVKCLAGAVPRAGSAVMLVTDGRQLFVLGAIADDTTIGATPLIQKGQATVSLSASATGNVAVTFPWEFPGTPNVVATGLRTATSNKTVVVNVDSLASTGFTAYLRVADGTALTENAPLRWLATYGP